MGGQQTAGRANGKWWVANGKWQMAQEKMANGGKNSKCRWHGQKRQVEEGPREEGEMKGEGNVSLWCMLGFELEK